MEIRGTFMIGRGIKVPLEGIYTDDGLFFHHVGTSSLTAEQIERLYEYGINYQQRKRFTPEEDDQVRENWREFAEEYNIPYENARFYAGAGDKAVDWDINELKKKRHFCLETNFWPRMCRDLVHRSAHQVKRRMLIIFDKAVIEGKSFIKSNRKNPLSYTEIINLIEAFQTHRSMRTAAEIINKPFTVCSNSYVRYMDKLGKVNRGEWICLWKTVLSFMEENDVKFEKRLQKAIRKNDNDKIESLSNMIDFERIESVLIRNKEFIKEAWNKLIQKLKTLYTKAYVRTQDKSAAWDEAIMIISSKRDSVPAYKFSIFLRILINCTDDEIGYQSFAKKYFDHDELQRRIIRSGITGFSLEGSYDTEMGLLLTKAKHILIRCEFYIFSKLACKFKLKERIQMVSMAFDRQIEKAKTDALDGKRLQGCTESDNDINITRITLQRTPIIEAVILFATRLDPDWIPPTTFKKYVTDKEVLKLFSEEKNNSALLSKKLIREYQENLPESINKRKHVDDLEPQKRNKTDLD